MSLNTFTKEKGHSNFLINIWRVRPPRGVTSFSRKNAIRNGGWNHKVNLNCPLWRGKKKSIYIGRYSRKWVSHCWGCGELRWFNRSTPPAAVLHCQGRAINDHKLKICMYLLKEFKIASLRRVPQAGIALLSSVASTSAVLIINERVFFLKLFLPQYVKSGLELYYL